MSEHKDALRALEADRDALVAVVEKMLPRLSTNRGHSSTCSYWTTTCRCGADEARALLARLRGEK